MDCKECELIRTYTALPYVTGGTAVVSGAVFSSVVQNLIPPRYFPSISEFANISVGRTYVEQPNLRTRLPLPVHDKYETGLQKRTIFYWS